MNGTHHTIWTHRDRATDRKWAECQTCGWKSPAYPGCFGSPSEDMEKDAAAHVDGVKGTC